MKIYKYTYISRELKKIGIVTVEAQLLASTHIINLGTELLNRKALNMKLT